MTSNYIVYPSRVVAITGGAANTPWYPRRYQYQAGVPAGSYGSGVFGDLLTNVNPFLSTWSGQDVEGVGSNAAGVADKKITYGFPDPATWDSTVPLVASTPVVDVHVEATVSTSDSSPDGMALELGIGRVGLVYAEAIPSSPPCFLDTANASRNQAFTLTYRVTAPDGAAWTVADLRDLRVAFVAGINGSQLYRLYNLSVRVNIVPPPVVTIDVIDTAAGGASTTPSDRQPAINVKYSQYGGYPAERFQVRLFSGSGAVNPDTAVPVWDSGQVLRWTADGSAWASRVGYPLSPGTYRAYARASDTRARWGPWAAGAAFTTSGTDLAAPTAISAAAGTVPGSVNVTVTAAAGAAVVVERSTDGGATWVPARMTTGLGTAPTSAPITFGSATVTFIGLDAPTGSVLYRARRVTLTSTAYVNGGAVTDLGSGPTSTSAWVTTGSAYVNQPTRAVLIDPETGTFVYAARRLRDLQSASEERQSVERAIGARFPIVSADSAVGAEVFSIELRLDAASWATFETLRKAQRRLRWLPELGPSMWVRLGPTRTETIMATGNARTTPTRFVTIGATQVDGP